MYALSFSDCKMEHALSVPAMLNGKDLRVGRDLRCFGSGSSKPYGTCAQERESTKPDQHSCGAGSTRFPALLTPSRKQCLHIRAERCSAGS